MSNSYLYTLAAGNYTVNKHSLHTGAVDDYAVGKGSIHT